MRLRQLHAPHAGRVERLQDGAVAQAFRRRATSGCCKHLLGFARPSARTSAGGAPCAAGSVRRPDCAGCSSAGPATGSSPSMACRRPFCVRKVSGCAVVLAVVIEPPLIALQDRPGDFGGRSRPRSCAPVDEVAHDALSPVVTVSSRVVLHLHPFQIVFEQRVASRPASGVRGLAGFLRAWRGGPWRHAADATTVRRGFALCPGISAFSCGIAVKTVLQSPSLLAPAHPYHPRTRPRPGAYSTRPSSLLARPGFPS